MKSKMTGDKDYQDELDVYEALFNMEKKEGKKLLTDEQRNKLIQSGRMTNSGEGSYKKGTRFDMKKMKQTYEIVSGLLVRMDQYKRRFYSDEAWDNYSEEERKRARGFMFLKIFKKSPREYGFELYKKMTG
ncbi:hypothetical protein A2783_01700 [Microgenomates group bacterium RIFCSPHIGHO2_01_FULL_45_11]|nr:MAG: hypothetical protein A2783_01700 [Microgenomates group bacterium RIFCSPHIGHO2_01_FULL_45_11]